ELGDIARFPSAKHVASYIGLTPRVRASADRVRSGHITREGNRLLRWVLVLAATQASRRPGPLRVWFRMIQSRTGKKRARVAPSRGTGLPLLEGRGRLLDDPATWCRAGVSSHVDMVLGPRS